MSFRRLLSGKALAWATPMLCELAALVRSVILAQMLGAEELGKVMLLALALRLAEMASDVSIERLILQAPDGGTDRFRAGMQGAVLLRGLVLAGILLALTLPIAWGFTDGPAALTAAALALVGLVRGAIHLDYRCREREGDYRGLLAVEGGATAVMLVAAPIAAWLLGDHRAFIPVVLVHALALVVLSHTFATRSFSLRFEGELLRRVLGFGVPLLANAALLFLIFHGDRMIVAGFFTWADVGRYAVALQLALLPAQIAGGAAGSILAPAFRRAIADGSLDTAVARANRAYALLAAAFFTAFAAAANMAVVLVYGNSFAIDLPLVLALAAVAAIRIARTPLSQQAVSLGRTDIPGRANLVRAAAVPGAFVAARASLPLAAIGAVGKALAAWRAARLLTTDKQTVLTSQRVPA